MPAVGYFFKRADFGRRGEGFGCLREITYNTGTLSFLTNYRPNFCSECGERIVRLRWRAWTSRRFCDKCSPQFRRSRLLQHAGVTVVVLLLGMMIGRGWRREPPPLVIQRPASVSSHGEAPAQPTITVEQNYLCGARTKKGTPCSRRVHGPVRCWQHKGAKAMLPLEKLLIKE
jgi:hypothetical protein